MIRNAKRKFEQKLAKNGNKKPFMAYVKSKTKHREGVGPLKVNGKYTNDDNEMANILNDFFSSVYTQENTYMVPAAPSETCENSLENIYFTETMIRTKIQNMKTSSSCGPDGISSKFLQTFQDQLSQPLSIIFNLSMSTGSVPMEWKQAHVTPIFKKGKKCEPSNYRPISLTSIPCRLMESIIKDHVMDHLLDNELIKKSQHGFIKNRSCTTNLLEFLEAVLSEIDEGNPVDVIYLDFSKAFDKVPKARLLEKIRARHIQGNIIKWISCWLTNRKQRVVLNGNFSEWQDVISGVPQGSVFGPLAFLIYIDDLDLETNDIRIMNKFADDTKLGHTVVSDNDRIVLQNCINRLLEWAVKWGMAFNIGKCKVLHAGYNNPGFQYNMNGTVLSEAEEEKDLGIRITKSLKPSMHCREAAAKANGVLKQILNAFHYRDRRTFLGLYKQHVGPHLEFASCAWSPWTN